MLKKSYLVIYILFLSCFNNSSKLELETISNVNLNKFMGDWYVIACIPTILEKNIVNAIENYSLNENNEIETTFSFRKKSVLNPVKTYKSKAIILNEKNNSEWEMQFFGGLFKSKYLIIDLSKDYSKTIVTVPNKNYLWIMSREPKVRDSVYSDMMNKLKKLDFDIEKIIRVPQIW